MKKPVRRPTPDEIAAFEETGKAARALDPALLATETQKTVSHKRNAVTGESQGTETQKSVPTEPQIHTDTEASIAVNTETQEQGNRSSRDSEKADSQLSAKAVPHKPANTETQISVPIVRLTIDLPEPAHTRFKTACAMTKRKMVEEVRAFFSLKTADPSEAAKKVDRNARQKDALWKAYREGDVEHGPEAEPVVSALRASIPLRDGRGAQACVYVSFLMGLRPCLPSRPSPPTSAARPGICLRDEALLQARVAHAALSLAYGSSG